MKKLFLVFILLIILGCSSISDNKKTELSIKAFENSYNNESEIQLINKSFVNNERLLNNSVNEINSFNKKPLISNCQPLISLKEFNQICNSQANETSTIELLSNDDVKKFCSTEFDTDLYSYAIINSIEFINHDYSIKSFNNKKSSFNLRHLSRLKIDNNNFITEPDSYINPINKKRYNKINVVVQDNNLIIELIFNFEKNKENFCSNENIVDLVKRILDD